MIISGSQLLTSYPFILVEPESSGAVFFLNNKVAKMGNVIDVYSGCDWVQIGDNVGYKSEGVDQIRFENVIYDLVPKGNILLTYIESLA